jgi:hypothetical protein
MIENRHRIEKEILRGRQAVRKVLQSRTRTLSPDLNVDTQGSSVPEPSTGTRLPRTSVSPVSDGPDIPLSVDTDAETAYANGIYSPVKPSRPIGTTVSTPRDGDNIANQDPLHSPSIRRKWTSELLDVRISDGTGNSSEQKAPRTHNPPTPKRISLSATSSGGFFTRFRARSFPTLASPFSTLHKSKYLAQEPSRTPVTGHPWSSDSSSEDLPLDDRQYFHPSTLSLRNLDGRDDGEADADTDSGGEDDID